MERKKFLFVSIDALISDIAWQVVKEGHEVKYFIETPSEKEIGDGFVPKTDDWRKEVDWADVIVFDDVLGEGTKAQKLRQEGKLVVGGTPYTDMLEDDRGFGQDELKKAGVTTIPSWNFTSFDDAINFVQEHPGKYVIKPSGEAQNVKQLLFVGEEDDGKDVIQVLEHYKKAWSDRIKVFQLQRKISGVEVAVGAFFNGREFIYPINVNFEHKKLFPGNIGPSTGEMGCYDEQTEVLTQNGWKFFRELNYYDELCTLNPSSREIEFHRPEVLVSFSHHRELVSIRNQTLDIAVTPDHNMYVSKQWDARRKVKKFGFVKARELQSQSVIPRTGKWIGQEQKYFVLPSVPVGHYSGNQVVFQQTGEVEIPMDDWLAFMGIWLAEGSVSYGKISVAQKTPEKTELIASMLKTLPFGFSRVDGEFYAYGKQLAGFLETFGKAHDKHIPSFIKELSPRQIDIFLNWFALGDATQMKGFRIFYTCSKLLADGIQELLLKTGKVGIIKKRQRQDRTWIKDHFADCSGVQYEVLESVRKLDSWIDKRDVTKVKYSGKVYCATVRNHVMFVRRNGKPYWCGNTSMFWSMPNKVFNATLKKMEPRLREEGYVGYIDINCIVNGYGIYPLEFTSRFGYPTISIQQEAMITPIGQFLYDLARGNGTKLKVRSGFQVGVRVVTSPFPFYDSETFDTHSKDAVIVFKKPHMEGVHIEDVKLANGEWLITGHAGVILIVVGMGSTMRQAQNQVYNRISNILIPNMYYRHDIGDRWVEDSDKLHAWTYLRE
jgi:phosphoribosylamine-glycine ligase